MDLIGMVLGLPLAPFRGLGALLEVLRDHAESQRSNELRSEAEEIDELLASGQITPAEAERRQEEMLAQLGVVPDESAQD